MQEIQIFVPKSAMKTCANGEEFTALVNSRLLSKAKGAGHVPADATTFQCWVAVDIRDASGGWNVVVTLGGQWDVGRERIVEVV